MEMKIYYKQLTTCRKKLGRKNVRKGDVTVKIGDEIQLYNAAIHECTFTENADKNSYQMTFRCHNVNTNLTRYLVHGNANGVPRLIGIPK